MNKVATHCALISLILGTSAVTLASSDDVSTPHLLSLLFHPTNLEYLKFLLVDIISFFPCLQNSMKMSVNLCNGSLALINVRPFLSLITADSTKICTCNIPYLIHSTCFSIVSSFLCLFFMSICLFHLISPYRLLNSCIYFFNSAFSAASPPHFYCLEIENGVVLSFHWDSRVL